MDFCFSCGATTGPLAAITFTATRDDGSEIFRVKLHFCQKCAWRFVRALVKAEEAKKETD